MMAESRSPALPIPATLVNGLAVAYLVALLFADYLSSWLPSLGGFPAGAIIRDACAIGLVAVAALALLAHRGQMGIGDSRAMRWAIVTAMVAGAISAASLLILVIVSDHRVAALLAARNLTLYFLAAGALWVLIVKGHVSIRVVTYAVWTLVLVAATLGILDTLTHGGLVTALGYSREYAGSTQVMLIAGAEAEVFGIVRASGGISNALVFGYLMAAAALTAAWFSAVARRGDRSLAWVGIVAVLAAGACVSSLTRGATIALVVGLLLLAIIERRRSMTGTALAIGLATVIASIAIPLAAGTMQPGSQSGSGLPPIFVRLGEGDEISQASSEARLDQLRAGLDALVDRPLGLGLASVGSAALRVRQTQPIVTDFFWLMVLIQVGVVVSFALLVTTLSAAVALLLAYRRAAAPLIAMAAVWIIAGFLSGAPDAPVFAGFTSVLAVLAATASAAMLQPVATPTAKSTALRRSPVGT